MSQALTRFSFQFRLPGALGGLVQRAPPAQGFEGPPMRAVDLTNPFRRAVLIVFSSTATGVWVLDIATVSASPLADYRCSDLGFGRILHWERTALRYQPQDRLSTTGAESGLIEPIRQEGRAIGQRNPE